MRWTLLLGVIAVVVLAVGSSAGSAGTLGDLVITTSARTLTAGHVTADVITVQRQNSGDPVSTGDTTINLTSDSTKGAFFAPDGTTSITSVTIPDGSSSADFKYYDETAGNPKITATDALGGEGFGSVDQTETVNPGPATHFSVSAPANATAGTAFSITVTAKDQFENTATGYLGTVHFTSTDTKVSTVLPSDYAFQAGDNGVHAFTDAVTLTTTPSQTVSATDTTAVPTITGTSGSIAVAPGPLDHFTIDTPTVVPSESGIAARAGHDSNATVTAYDAYENIKTDYNPAASDVTLSGDLTNSTTGCPQTPVPTPCAPIYSGAGYGVGAFTNGTGTATFRPFQKEASRHLTVTDTALSKSGTSSAATAFAVKAGDLDHFTVAAPTPAPQAGHNSTVQITAYDAYGNVKDDYAGSPTMTGNLSSSTTGSSCSVGSPCNPTYSVGAFTAGNATGSFTPVVATEPGPPLTATSETDRNVTVADGVHNGTSPNFSVLPGEPTTLTFTNQPTETCNAAVGLTTCASDNTKSAIINGIAGVQVRAQDAFGNNAYNTTVTIAIAAGFNPGATTLKPTPTVSKATGPTGIAVFNNLRIEVVGIGYRLAAIAPSPPATQTAGPTNSAAFKIAQTVTTCTSTACAGSATDQPNSVVTVTGTGTNLGGNTLGIALAGNGPPIPAGVCSLWGAAPNYPASYIDVNAVVTAGPTPSLTITWKIPKSVVTKIPNIPNNTNNGASHYDICLGSVNLQNPLNTPPLTPNQIWPTKDGGRATPVLDTNFGVVFFWGIIPDCAKKGPLLFPCMQSRNKDSLGNLMLTYFVPYPWDPTGWAGGHI